MAPSGDRNVKLIASAAAAAAAAAATASVPTRIVNTFGQRANDDEDTRGQTKLKDGGDDEKRRLAPRSASELSRRPPRARAGLPFPEAGGSSE